MDPRDEARVIAVCDSYEAVIFDYASSINPSGGTYMNYITLPGPAWYDIKWVGAFTSAVVPGNIAAMVASAGGSPIIWIGNIGLLANSGITFDVKSVYCPATRYASFWCIATWTGTGYLSIRAIRRASSL